MEVYTQKDEIKAAFKVRKRRQIVATVVLIPAIILVLSHDRGSDRPILGVSENILLVAAVILFLGALLFSFLNWRCPSCGKYLGKTFAPKFCSKCGAELS